MARPAIAVENLSKRYRIGPAASLPYRTLREAISEAVAGRLRRAPRAAGVSQQILWALNDVSLEVQPGEVVGIIGRNGAGKSTLLKVLSRVTPPTRGRVEIRGAMASLLEVGTGFHPELTGRENVFLNGSLLGMSRGETRQRLDAIASFAEVENHLDTPVKKYSSGMYMRLAFAVAIHTRPDVLLVDEVLAVGDVAFVNKCMAAIQELRQSRVAIVVVSHNMWHVQTVCDRAVVLAHGTVAYSGAPLGAIASYRHQSMYSEPTSRDRVLAGGHMSGVLDLQPEEPEGLSTLSPDSRVCLHFTYAHPRPAHLRALVRVTTNDYLPLFTSYSEPWEQHPEETVRGRVLVPRLSLLPGDYRIWVAVCGPGLEDEKLAVADLPIKVTANQSVDGKYALFDNPAEWQVETLALHAARCEAVAYAQH